MGKYAPVLIILLACATLVVNSKMRHPPRLDEKEREFAVPTPVDPYANTSKRTLANKPRDKVAFKLSGDQTPRQRLYERKNHLERSISSVR